MGKKRKKGKAHDEPAKDSQSTSLGIGGICNSGKEVGTLAPVG